MSYSPETSFSDCLLNCSICERYDKINLERMLLDAGFQEIYKCLQPGFDQYLLTLKMAKCIKNQTRYCLCLW